MNKPQTGPDDFPDVIRIEPSGKCNFRCSHCPTGAGSNNRLFLNPEQFSAIMAQWKSIPRVAVLYHGGEPLLNKNIAQYVEKLKDRGVGKVQIVTNGSLLTGTISKQLILAGLDEIHISFDGESAAENNLIRKNGDFQKDADQVKEFYKLYKKIGKKRLRVLITNVRVLSSLRPDPALKDGHEEIPSYLINYFADGFEEIEFQSVAAMVWPGLKVPAGFKVMSFPGTNPEYCGPLFETLSILANGDVVPCCYDLRGEAVLGNVFQTNIYDIWNSREYKEFRTDFKRRSYPEICLKCNVVAPRYLCRDLG